MPESLRDVDRVFRSTRESIAKLEDLASTAYLSSVYFSSELSNKLLKDSSFNDLMIVLQVIYISYESAEELVCTKD